MSDVQQRPVLLFAFAAEDSTIQVEEEARAIEVALASVSGDEGLCKVVVPPFLKVEDVLDLFQRNRNTVAVFHYAGHANGAELLMRTAQGAGTGAAGLATSVRSQAGLKLVFLNGCSTEAQVEQWMAAGVPCVIATTRAIHGEVAKNFAARFYHGLATGASIQTAYDEAVGEADASLKGPSRLLMPVDEAPMSQRASDRWPWFIRYAAGAEDVADWNLADAAGDPLAFLPLGKGYRLPDAPYPGLRRFTAHDAAVFFGRGRDIRKLYERVTSESAAPIILLHGQAGVGKSSILEAGLAPRLKESYGSGELRNKAWDVETVRIDPQKPLLDSLRNLFRTESEQAELAKCWREREEQSGQPLLVVLDQVEEVFTHTAAARLQEDWNALVAELEQLFSNQESSPRGKLMFSFRTEWFSRVNQQLSGLWKSEVFIQSLDAVGIVEAIEGPTRRRELQDQYHLEIESGLGERIAGDLMEDSQAAVAPTLQILLKKLWEEASRISRQPKLTEQLYRSHRATLGEFVRAQFEKIATHPHLSEAAQAAVKAGLLADFLECHVTDELTSRQLSLKELTEGNSAAAPPVPARYPDRGDVLSELRQLAIDHYLLIQPDSGSNAEAESSSRLAHDSLAIHIHQIYEASDAPGQQARRILEQRAREWAVGTQDLLDIASLKATQAGKSGMRAWTPQEEEIVEKSWAWRRRRNALAVVVPIILGIAFFFYRLDWYAQEIEGRLYCEAYQVPDLLELAHKSPWIAARSTKRKFQDGTHYIEANPTAPDPKHTAQYLSDVRRNSVVSLRSAMILADLGKAEQAHYELLIRELPFIAEDNNYPEFNNMRRVLSNVNAREWLNIVENNWGKEDLPMNGRMYGESIEHDLFVMFLTLLLDANDPEAMSRFANLLDPQSLDPQSFDRYVENSGFTAWWLPGQQTLEEWSRRKISTGNAELDKIIGLIIQLELGKITESEAL